MEHRVLDTEAELAIVARSIGSRDDSALTLEARIAGKAPSFVAWDAGERLVAERPSEEPDKFAGLETERPVPRNACRCESIGAVTAQADPHARSLCCAKTAEHAECECFRFRLRACGHTQACGRAEDMVGVLGLEGLVLVGISYRRAAK